MCLEYSPIRIWNMGYKLDWKKIVRGIWDLVWECMQRNSWMGRTRYQDVSTENILWEKSIRRVNYKKKMENGRTHAKDSSWTT